MKIQTNTQSPSRGFTLTEMLVVTAIFSVLVLTTVCAQVFGLRMYAISERKLSVTADARTALNRLRDEVRASKSVSIGNGDAGSFRTIAASQPQKGNGLRICRTANTNSYVYYFVDTSDSTLNRMVSGRSTVQVIATGITNQFAFQSEDFDGNVLTNSARNKVIGMCLQFNQREYAANSSGALSDFYQLQTRIARRTKD